MTTFKYRCSVVNMSIHEEVKATDTTTTNEWIMYSLGGLAIALLTYFVILPLFIAAAHEAAGAIIWLHDLGVSMGLLPLSN